MFQSIARYGYCYIYRIPGINCKGASRNTLAIQDDIYFFSVIIDIGNSKGDRNLVICITCTYVIVDAEITYFDSYFNI